VKAKLLSIFLLGLPSFASFSGYFQASSFYSEFYGENEILQVARLRAKFETNLWSFRIKVHGEAGAFSSPKYLQPLLTGSSLEDTNPVYFYRGNNERIYFYLDRASVSYSTEKFLILIGRDRFPWGKARLFSLLDVFNPYEPFALVREERQGINGVRARAYFSGFSWAEGIFVRRMGKSIYGGSLFFSAGNFDFQFAIGHFKREFFGSAFEGNIKGVGLRGELVLRKGGKLESNLGFDWQITPKLYILGEYLRSEGFIFPKIKLLSLSSNLQLTPLITLNFTGVLTDPEGKILLAGLSYSAAQDLDLNFSFLYCTSSSYWALPKILGSGFKLYF